MKVVGGGPELRRLRARYGERAEFLGRVGDAELAGLYARALALVVPGVEEFGIVSVEAQAAGRPVIALASSGAAESVIDGETGVLVESGDPDAFAEAMREVDFRAFDRHAARTSAARFAVPRFQAAFGDAVSRAFESSSSAGAGSRAAASRN